jgi:hypothetical protein
MAEWKRLQLLIPHLVNGFTRTGGAFNSDFSNDFDI